MVRWTTGTQRRVGGETQANERTEDDRQGKAEHDTDGRYENLGMENQKVNYGNPLDFTHSQADALRTIHEIFELAKEDNIQLIMQTVDAVNLAKCFIELETTIKDIREKVKDK